MAWTRRDFVKAPALAALVAAVPSDGWARQAPASGTPSAPAGASVHGWMRVLEQMAPHYPADALYVYGHAEAGHPFIGTRADLLYQRDCFSAAIDHARRARTEGRTRETLAKADVLAGFEHVGGQKPRLGLALTIAYDELAKTD